MKKVFAFLSAAIVAAILCGCGSAPAQDRTPGAAGDNAMKESKSKEPARDIRKKAGKKKADAKKRKKRAGGKSSPARESRSPFSTPPPGTGYGNLDPEPSPPDRK